jgi:hypothetical protein
MSLHFLEGKLSYIKLMFFVQMPFFRLIYHALSFGLADEPATRLLA